MCAHIWKWCRRSWRIFPSMSYIMLSTVLDCTSAELLWGEPLVTVMVGMWAVPSILCPWYTNAHHFTPFQTASATEMTTSGQPHVYTVDAECNTYTNVGRHCRTHVSVLACALPPKVDMTGIPNTSSPKVHQWPDANQHTRMDFTFPPVHLGPRLTLG